MRQGRLVPAAGFLVGGYLLSRLAYEVSVALASNHLSPGLAALAPAPLYIGLAVVVAGLAGRIAGMRLIGPAFSGPRGLLYAASGAGSGILLASIIFGIALATGVMHVTPNRLSAHFGMSLAAGALIAASIACAEETIFRGSLIPLLTRAFPAQIAVLVSSGLFAAVHLRGPGTGPVYLVGVFLLGVLLGLVYRATRTIWFPIGLHAGWNLAQSGALLLKQSGILGLVQPTGPLVVGGPDAIEAGLLGLALLLTAALIVLRFAPRALSPTGQV